MKKGKLYCFCFMLLILSVSCIQKKPFQVSELTGISEKEINVSRIALQLAKELDPGVDVEKYESQLDEMAEEIRKRTKGRDDPLFRIWVLNSYIKEKGFGYDYEDGKAKKLSNKTLSGFLETRKGSCVTFPLLYVSLGQRLGYPIYPVLAPEHFIVRYVDPRLTYQNIETTSASAEVPDSFYIKELTIPEMAIKNGAYLRTLTYKEYLSELIAINAFVRWHRDRDFSKGLEYVNIALSLKKDTPELYRLKGGMLFNQAKVETNPRLAMSYLRESNQLGQVARDLGWVRPPREEYEAMLKVKAAAVAGK